MTAAVPPTAEMWHRRFAHLGATLLERTAGAVDGMHLNKAQVAALREADCPPCTGGKMVRAPFHARDITTTEPLQLIHTDAAGPMEIRSAGGAVFMVSVIDDYSRYKALVPLQTKGEAKDVVMTVVNRWEVQTKRRVQVVRSDGGKEYTGKDWPRWVAEKGLQHQTTTRYTPQSNGVAERYNRVVVERMMAALLDSGLDRQYWAEAAVTVNYLGNRVVGRTQSVTPYELFHGVRPNVAHLRPFGCRAWVHVPSALRGKLSPRAVEGIFVGYGVDQKGYRILVDGKVETSRDVRFAESADALLPSSRTRPAVPRVPTDPDYVHFPDELNAVGDNAGAATATHMGLAHTHPTGDSTAPPAAASIGAAVAAARVLTSSARANATASPASDDGDVGGEDTSGSEGDDSAAEDGDVATAAPTALRPCPSSGDNSAPRVFASRSSVRLLRAHPPQRGHASTAVVTAATAGTRLGAIGWALATKGGRAADKMRIHQARRAPDWAAFDAAVKAEVDALWRNGTWYLTDLPPGKAVTDTEMLCERKRGPDGQVVRWKGRYVGRGDKQTYLLDYDEVWAPVARYATLRTLLAHCAAEGMTILQLDIETAFLNGEVEEEIYVRKPKGYERGDTTKVCRLVKALYGLKQAARAWHKKLDAVLASAGFTPCDADPCLYKGARNDVVVFILIFVDDLLVAAATKAAAESAKAAITAVFKAREMGEPSFFLGLHIVRDTGKGTLQVGQHQYVTTLLERFGLDKANPVRLPMGVSARLTKDGSPLMGALIKTYQELVGSLLYLATGTRPDISFAVGQLTRHVAAPTMEHLAAAKTVLRYLKGTASLGLTYGSAAAMIGYSDADYAGDLDTRRSTTGYVFTFNGAAVSWTSKRQPSVAHSTTESEYIAAATAAKEAVWLSRLITDLTGTEAPMRMRCDNQSALAIMHNPVSSPKTKHIDIAYHFVREKVADKQLLPEHVPTGEMAADILTKPLPVPAYTTCRTAMELVAYTL